MPKIFDDQQREEVVAKILSIARDEFGKKGFKKTSIGKITKKVGIASGTFYNFFPSKEALFLAIIGEFELEKFRLIDKLFTANGNPVEEFHLFLSIMFENVASDPIFMWLSKENLYERIVQKIPQEELIKHMAYDIEASDAILNSVQPRGFLQNMSSQQLVSHLRALFMATIHIDEIGAPDFNAFMETQIAIFVAGLEALEGGTND